MEPDNFRRRLTVLFDGRYAHYHLYYANANAEVGSVFTTFPFQARTRDDGFRPDHRLRRIRSRGRWRSGPDNLKRTGQEQRR